LSRTFFVTTAAAVFAFSFLAPPAVGQNGLGPFLAARHAERLNDFEKAADFYTQALAQNPSDANLIESAMAALVNKGDVGRAVTLAETLYANDRESQLAALILMADAAVKGDFDKAAEFLQAPDQFSPLMAGLMKGWVKIGQGQVKEAFEHFEDVGSETSLGIFAQNHRALALAMVGNFEAADVLLEGGEDGSLRIDRGSIVAHAQIMAQLGKNNQAVQMIDNSLRGNNDPELEALRRNIDAGAPVDYTYITTPKRGVAEVFNALASAINSEDNHSLSLLYARLAQYVAPSSVEIALLVAENLEELGQYGLATHTYDKVPPDHPRYFSAEIGRADSLFSQGREDASVEVLKALSKSHAQISTVHSTLGNTLRRLSRFEEAVVAYDNALALFETYESNQWFLFYARGISFERLDKWKQAEPDFRKALELRPNQPNVLNYLGYSLVEKRLKLDEALKMIETAVASQPNDGYITDSLGWVLYRLGDAQSAVPHMERAVELMPLDPIINDHLGDVLWAVGRVREAEFQWRRALSFEPEEEDAVRIRRKLDVGLEEVLKEESDVSVTLNEN
jgi:tetratricopeptide (TPR) repeat protein